ncbi:MAG TPA: hypothetical protein VNL77_25415 [Roseiflexaceae bacterium]|nr:hypothetical protein [Roseiflexaceae bacterium]
MGRIARRVEVYRLEGPAYTQAAALGEGEEITSPPLPGFACPVRGFFYELTAQQLEERPHTTCGGDMWFGGPMQARRLEHGPPAAAHVANTSRIRALLDGSPCGG